MKERIASYDKFLSEMKPWEFIFTMLLSFFLCGVCTYDTVNILHIFQSTAAAEPRTWT